MRSRVVVGVLALAVSACAVGESSGPRLDSRPEPPALLIDDAEGSHSLKPLNFCWEYKDGPGTAGTCAEGALLPGGGFPGYHLTEDETISLNFQFAWDQLSASVRPEDGSCDPYLIEFIEPRGFVFHELGPPGDYLVELDALAERGDAHWMIRIHNRADLPYPEGASC